MNLLAYQFEQQLNQLIINSGLEPSMIFYILQNTNYQIWNLYLQVIQKEKEQITNSTAQALNEKLNSKLNNLMEEKEKEESSGQE